MLAADPRSVEFSKFVDRVLENLRRKRREGQEDPTCTFEELWTKMSSDERNSFPSFQKKNYLLGEFSDRIRENPKIHFDSGRNIFTFKKRFESPNALVDRLYRERSGVEDKDDLHDDVSKSQVDNLLRGNLLRLVEIKENKSKTIRVLLSKNTIEDPVEKMGLEETAPKELGEYWDLFDKSHLDQEKFNRHSASEYLYRDPRMTIKKAVKRKPRRFFNDEDINRWQNKHLLDKIETAMDILDKQAPPDQRRPLKRLASKSAKQRRDNL